MFKRGSASPLMETPQGENGHFLKFEFVLTLAVKTHQLIPQTCLFRLCSLSSFGAETSSLMSVIYCAPVAAPRHSFFFNMANPA